MQRVAVIVARPPLAQHRHHFRDHVAGTAHDDGVADAHIEAGNLVGVVQGGIGDGDACHPHRRQPRHRREHAGTADLHVDGLHRGQFFERGKLVRDGPTRRARDEPHGGLLRIVVELVDHAVDVVRQTVALRADLCVIRQQARRSTRGIRLGRHRKAEFAQALQRLRVPCRKREALVHTQRVGEKRQRPLRGDRRIELSQRAGGAVARVGQRLFAMRQRAFVEFFKAGARHVHLAAHFQHGRCGAAQVQRDGTDGADIGGYIFAAGTIAARRRAYQRAMFVAQADGQAVELGLDRKQRFAFAGVFDDTAHEGMHLVVAEGIAQRQHRQLVHHLGEPGRGFVAYPLGRRVGHDQFGMLGFQRLQFAHQAVVFGVRDARRIEHEIAVVGVVDPAPQLSRALLGAGRCGMRLRILRRHHQWPCACSALRS